MPTYGDINNYYHMEHSHPSTETPAPVEPVSNETREISVSNVASKGKEVAKEEEGLESSEELRGTLWKDCMQCTTPWRITTWPDIVARLAFGGLVPITTRRVVNIVRFSTGSAAVDKTEGKRDMKALETLMTLVQLGIKNKMGQWIPIFGDRFQERLRHGKKDSNIDYGSQALGVFDEDMTDTMRHLG